MKDKPVEIVFIDDEVDMLESWKRILEHMHYQCHTASSGRLGIELIQKIRPNIVITDLRMPDVDGLCVLQECRKIDPETVVIILTAFGTVQSAVEAMKNGASDYLQKPFTADQLQKVLHRYNNGKKSIDSCELPEPKEERYKIVNSSRCLLDILSQVDRFARTDANVMITGESGTGKELIAHRIHASSKRAKNLFVPVDCACLSESLLESELFGHVKGAFTSADANKTGIFELSNHGTLFFDEISHLTSRAQAKLLRVLQERQFRPLGSKKIVDVDVRILSATNRDLEEDVRRGEFREDLYFRLNVVSVVLPPLRERKEDIPLLIEHFLKKHASKNQKAYRMSQEAMAILLDYNWPGNVRELENLVQRCIALAADSNILPEHLPEVIRANHPPFAFSVKEKLTDVVRVTEREQILRVLQSCEGERSRAAQILGISRKSLWQKMKAYNIHEDEINGK